MCFLFQGRRFESPPRKSTPREGWSTSCRHPQRSLRCPTPPRVHLPHRGRRLPHAIARFARAAARSRSRPAAPVLRILVRRSALSAAPDSAPAPRSRRPPARVAALLATHLAALSTISQRSKWLGRLLSSSSRRITPLMAELSSRLPCFVHLCTTQCGLKRCLPSLCRLGFAFNCVYPLEIVFVPIVFFQQRKVLHSCKCEQHKLFCLCRPVCHL